MNLLLKRALLVHEINDVLQVDATVLSHHLRILRESGLLVARREGKARRYSISRKFRAPEHTRTLDFGCCKLILN